MTKQEREVYLEDRGWRCRWRGYEAWKRDDETGFHTFLGAFMRQQAADARAEREADSK